MSPQFNNMNELTSYLETMESRVKALENQNESLKQAATENAGDTTKILPRTGLLSRNFFARAFTVWGHNFVAQLIICIVVCGILLAVVLLVPGMVALIYRLTQGWFVP